MFIDNDAKLRVSLFRKFGSDDNEFFMGKLQFPGNISFKRGVSFMVFTSEKDAEELQISPSLDGKQLPPARAPRNRGPRAADKVHIDLHPMTDKNGGTFYVGEARGPMNIEMDDGIFITVFLSRPGEEEIQIGFLDHEKVRRPSEFPGKSYSPLPRTYNINER